MIMIQSYNIIGIAYSTNHLFLFLYLLYTLARYKVQIETVLYAYRGLELTNK